MHSYEPIDSEGPVRRLAESFPVGSAFDTRLRRALDALGLSDPTDRMAAALRDLHGGKSSLSEFVGSEAMRGATTRLDEAVKSELATMTDEELARLRGEEPPCVS